MAETYGIGAKEGPMMQPGTGVPSEAPIIRAERELKEARELGVRLYEYALTQHYIVWDTGRGLASVRAQVARLEGELAEAKRYGRQQEASAETARGRAEQVWWQKRDIEAERDKALGEKEVMAVALRAMEPYLVREQATKALQRILGPSREALGVIKALDRYDAKDLANAITDVEAVLDALRRE